LGAPKKFPKISQELIGAQQRPPKEGESPWPFPSFEKKGLKKLNWPKFLMGGPKNP